jgi:hypothetical protein
MLEQSEPKTPDAAQIKARLHEVAQSLRQTRQLSPEAQKVLAELVDALGNELQAPTAPAPALAQLADSAAHVVDALRHEKNQTLLKAARARLNDAVLKAEMDAPFLTGIARRLLAALADIGI